MDIDFSLLKIDRNSPVPISTQIAVETQRYAEKGALLPGDKLPPERELAALLNLSRGTVKKAYAYLEENGVIETVRGSGSYVAGVVSAADFRKKKEAMQLITAAISKLNKLGFSAKEISAMFGLVLSAENADRVLKIAIIGSNQEALIDYRNQLQYLSNTALSIFILESITMDSDPHSLLSEFDMIITPTKQYEQIKKTLSKLEDKIIEAATSPSQQTLTALSKLDKNSRIGIVCRTDAFLQDVSETLNLYGFKRKNIQSYFEANYSTKTYFQGGIHALISFEDAHIYTDPAFEPRNEELFRKGGTIIKYTYQLERGTLIYIEAKLRQLLQNLKDND